MEKVYKTMVFEIMLQKGIEKISPFLTCPFLIRTFLTSHFLINFLILRFDLHLQNGNIFVEIICPIRKYSKISPEPFQIKFSYLILIKTFPFI